jgi:SH3-like domain-containing protein
MARAAKYKAAGLSGADLKVLSFPDGAVLAPKIDNVALRAAANDAAKLVIMLKKTDELVFLGEEEGTFVKVQGSNGEGWVKKSLVAKK